MSTESDTHTPPSQCGSTLLISGRSVLGCDQDVGHEGAHAALGETWTRWAAEAVRSGDQS